VKQLQQATQIALSPDPIDFYALAVGLEHLGRYGDAADAYQKCSQIAGNVETLCKASADRIKGQAAIAK
jgi:hypothetical protein